MTTFFKASLLAAAAAAPLFFAGAAHAQAFYLQEQSARAAGLCAMRSTTCTLGWPVSAVHPR